MKKVDIHRLDHHGIVSGVFAELGFEKMIDDWVGVDEKEKVTTGQAVKAMVISGLGFTQRPLVLTPQFFSNLAVDKLVGSGLTADDLNRHKLGRALDALATVGCEGIFSVLASSACELSGINRDVQSLDRPPFP